MFKISAVALASAIGLIVEDKFIRFADTDKWWKRWGSFYLMASEYNKFMFVYLKNFAMKLKEGN